ncbi:MAG: YihY/virulence factor BrkB family protein [Deltaproteobacteria bacterium]|jgi:membrane protein|nr:YihY/virulence factor BrkB family protein [Deltaproteobacteria bacterium]
MPSNISVRFNKIIRFIQEDIWRIRRALLPRCQSFFITFLRVIILSIRGFDEDKCSLRASALTFYSLISIVPVFAMAFGIAKGFGFEKILEAQLRNKLTGQEEVLNNIILFSHSLLENTKGGLIAGIGIIVLFWAVIKVLGHIEDSLNDIWGVKEKRSLARKFSDYLSLMLICPVIIILSSGVTIFITTQITFTIQKISVLGALNPLIRSVLEILPCCLIWGLFTFIYIFMPNTKVRFTSGLLAGIVAGTIFQIVQWGYISFQIGAAQYNAIYGSFAAIPLFLIWLQLSWFIVLYGAELAFAHQHVDTYEFEPDALQSSHRFKLLLSLAVLHCLIQNFIKEEKPLTTSQLVHRLDIPIRMINDILFTLKKSRIIAEAMGPKEDEAGFLPACDINKLTVQYVVDAIETVGINSLPHCNAPSLSAIKGILETFQDTLKELPANKLVKDL